MTGHLSLKAMCWGKNLLTGALGLLALSLGCVLSVREFTQVLLLGAGCAGEGTRPMAVPGAAGGRVPLAVSLGCHIPAMPGPHQGAGPQCLGSASPGSRGVHRSSRCPAALRWVPGTRALSLGISGPGVPQLRPPVPWHPYTTAALLGLCLLFPAYLRQSQQPAPPP